MKNSERDNISPKEQGQANNQPPKAEDQESSSVKKIKEFNDEILKLMKTKEKRIKDKFIKLSEDMGKKTKLYDIIYFDKSKNNEIEEDKISKEEEEADDDDDDDETKPLKKGEPKELSKKYSYCGCICFKVYIFGFLFFLFYLVSFFQLLDLFDVCKKELGIIFHSFFYNTKRQSNESFIELYINSCFRNIPEFDFAFFTSIIGSLPLEGCGFFLSSIFFTAINSILFVGFTKYDFEREKFGVIDFLYILIYFVIFFITFGAISLFAHQKYSEGVFTFIKMKERLEKEIQGKDNDIKKEENINKEENIKKEENIIKEENINKENKNELDKMEEYLKIEEKREEKEEIEEINLEDIAEKEIKEINIENTNENIIQNNTENIEKNNEPLNIENIEEVKRNVPTIKENKNNSNNIRGNTNREESNNCWKEGGLFVFLCFGIILAYALNRAINLYLYKFKSHDFFEEHFAAFFLTIYIGGYIISLIMYLFFYVEIVIINNQIDDKEDNTENFFRIFGFLIYYEKIPVRNHKKKVNLQKEPNKTKIYESGQYIQTSSSNNNNPQDIPQNNVQNNITHYGSRNKIGISQNEQPININTNNKAYESTENKNNNDSDNSHSSIICQTLFPCCKTSKKDNEKSKYTCASCKIGFRKCYYRGLETEYKSFCCDCCECQECCSCCSCCQCCECCKNSNLKERYQENEIFCYAYQIQRKCSWFCDLFFKGNVFSLIIHNIVVELGIIGFEKKINGSLEEKGIYSNLNSIIVYLGFFLLFVLLFSGLFICTSKKNDFNNFSVYSLIFFVVNISLSGLSFIGRGKIKKIVNDYLIFFTLSYAKFLNFLVMKSLVRILDTNNIDILSNSFIMTSVFVIYDIYVFVVTDFINMSTDLLVKLQFILGFFEMIFFLILTFCSIKDCCAKCCKKCKKCKK